MLCKATICLKLRPWSLSWVIIAKDLSELNHKSVGTLTRIRCVKSLQIGIPGPRIVPSCHSGWGAVSDLGGSYAERGFKMGPRHSGTTTRAKTAPFQLSFHTLIFCCFVLIPSLCLLSASFFPLC